MGFVVTGFRFQNSRMNNIKNENLFRQQAIAALCSKQPGAPICLMPRPWGWLTGLTAVIFASVIFFISNAEYARKETVRGWLVSKQGVVRISNPVPAVISEVVRRPGDHVRQGEPLIYLSTDATLADGNSKSGEVLAQIRQEMLELDTQLSLSKEQQQLEASSLKQQLKEFDAESAALMSRLADQNRRIGLSRDKLRRLEDAELEGAVTDWDVLKQREELRALEQGLNQLGQDTAGHQRERERMTGQLSSVSVRAEIQRSTLRGRRMQLFQQIAEQNSRRLSVLESPLSGTVASVEVHAGYSATPGQLLMTVLPIDLELAAEVFVPSRAAGFVQAGQTVRIAYDAFPQLKFGTFTGRITRISKFVLLPDEIPQTFSQREATYKIRIAIDESSIETSIGAAGLRPGMLLAADIVLEKRNLIDWLLEPLRFRRSTPG